MLKKIVATLIVISMLGVIPMIAGCQENEYKYHEQKETTHTETHTVVE